jgi:hypothetical protein
MKREVARPVAFSDGGIHITELQTIAEGGYPKVRRLLPICRTRLRETEFME